MLKEKPEGYFNQVKAGAVYFEGYDEQGPYGYTAIEFIIGYASMHLQVIRWSHGILKKMIGDWKYIREFCQFRKCKGIIATQPDTADLRWPKLIKHFGFKQPELIWVSRQEF